MKILITADNIGGVWTYALNLARGLKKEGIETCIAVTGDHLTDYQKDELGFTEWYFLRSKQEWMHDPWDDIKNAGEWLLDLVNDLKPDLVHLNSYSTGSLPWNIPVVIAAHSCVLSWWEAVKEGEIPVEWERYREAVSAGLRSADVVVAPGNSMMEAVEKFYAPAGKKRVIYNGADSSLFKPAKKKNFVFSMGRLWDEAKNIKLVLEAAPDISYPVYIAGDTGDQDAAKNPGNVHFLGRLTPSEISEWLSAAALYLLPVKYEPFGYTFLEAALSGCAIITGNTGSMREIWNDSVVYADTFDSRELAVKVNGLMQNSRRRKCMAAKARSRAMERYTIGRMTGEYIDLYGSVLETGIREKFKLEVS